jgi:hypothetical protein
MKNKLKLLAVALIAGGTMFAQPRVSIGVGVGGYGPGYYPPPAYAQAVPPCPGPGYAWVDGYWAPQGGRNVWINGFWRAPSVGAYREAPRVVAPRYDNAYRGNDRARDHEDHGHDYSNGFRR